MYYREARRASAIVFREARAASRVEYALPHVVEPAFLSARASGFPTTPLTTVDEQPHLLREARGASRVEYALPRVVEPAFLSACASGFPAGRRTTSGSTRHALLGLSDTSLVPRWLALKW